MQQPPAASHYSIALEEQLASLRVSVGMLQSRDKAVDPVKPMDVLTVEMFRRAEPFYVEDNICRLIEAGIESFPDTYLYEADLFTHAGYAWFAKPLELPETATWLEGSNRLPVIAWIATHQDANGDRYVPDPMRKPTEVVLAACPIYKEIPRAHALIPFTYISWPLGKSLQWVIENAPNTAVREDLNERAVLELKYWASLLFFLKQQLLVTKKERAGRSTRKRAQSFAPDMERLINVVELRRKTIRHRESEAHEEVEWSYQWIVRGHWRNQWYRSQGRHQPVWISPYVKGPEDKPLKSPRARVFAVVR